MKYLATVIVAAGLASAANAGTPVVARQDVSAAVETSAAAASEAAVSGDNAAQLESIANIFNGTGINANISDSQFDPASFGVGNLNVDGLDLGSVDLSNQNDIVNAILSMMNSLCLGGLFNSNSILNLGGSANLQLFLELAQLMQLQQLGFLNLVDIQSLVLGGFGINNFNGLNGLNLVNGLRGLNGFGGFNSFNFGVFKREVDERKKTVKRTTLRRTNIAPLSKRQCQAGVIDPNVISSIAGATNVAVADPNAVAATTQPSVAPAATEAPAGEAVASQPAAQTTRESRPSDFT